VLHHITPEVVSGSISRQVSVNKAGPTNPSWHLPFRKQSNFFMQGAEGLFVAGTCTW